MRDDLVSQVELFECKSEIFKVLQVVSLHFKLDLHTRVGVSIQ